MIEDWKIVYWENIDYMTWVSTNIKKRCFVRDEFNDQYVRVKFQEGIKKTFNEFEQYSKGIKFKQENNRLYIRFILIESYTVESYNLNHYRRFIFRKS